MARTRTKRTDKELDKVDKIKHENSKLKRQVGQLRKEIENLQHMMAHYEKFKEYSKQRRIEAKKDKAEKKKDLKKWKCFECGEGHLEKIVVPRADGVFYFRSCNTCNNRTKMKKWHEGVED